MHDWTGFVRCALVGLALGTLSAYPVLGETRAEETASCDVPLPMRDGARPGHHFHPTVSVLIFRRGANPSSPVHYPLRTLRPDAGLGIERAKDEARDGEAAGALYREIHAHDGTGTLHVEPRASGQYRLCNLVALWLASPEFRSVWQKSAAAGGIHVWIGSHHIRHIGIEQLLAIPLEHDLTITICIEEAVSV